MITANARTIANLNPRLSGACAICSPHGNKPKSADYGAPPRQAHGEHRAFALLACHGHVTAHHARELAGDGEAETGAAEAPRGRGIGLAELLEQLCLLLRGHPDAGVGDGELDDVAAIAHFACRKLDLARFGELTRIAQQVQEYLP